MKAKEDPNPIINLLKKAISKVVELANKNIDRAHIKAAITELEFA